MATDFILLLGWLVSAFLALVFWLEARRWRNTCKAWQINTRDAMEAFNSMKQANEKNENTIASYKIMVEKLLAERA